MRGRRGGRFALVFVPAERLVDRAHNVDHVVAKYRRLDAQKGYLADAFQRLDLFIDQLLYHVGGRGLKQKHQVAVTPRRVAIEHVGVEVERPVRTEQACAAVYGNQSVHADRLLLGRLLDDGRLGHDIRFRLQLLQKLCELVHVEGLLQKGVGRLGLLGNCVAVIAGDDDDGELG